MRNLLAVPALATLLAASPSAGYLDGPPDARAGNPPLFEDCTGCHSSFPLNSGDGSLDISGAPAAYVPDSIYTFLVTISDPGQMRWGFELTVQDEAFDQAGFLSRLDNSVRVDIGAGPAPDYAKHTLAGLQTGQPSGDWSIRWKAPSAGTGTAHVWWAGNAANADGTFFNDYIYTRHLAIPETAPSSVPGFPPAAVPALAVFPNPLRPGGTVSYSVSSGASPRLDVFDARGRLVRRLLDGAAAGEGAAAWDGRDGAGRDLPSGVYLVALSDRKDAAHSSRILARRVLLVR